MHLENLLLKSAQSQDCQNEFEEITSFYGSDIDSDKLETQLVTYKVMFKKFKTGKICLCDVVDFMRQPGHSELFSEVSTVLQLMLVMPSSNAECERKFSGLKRCKTYLRNSMGQNRLNHLQGVS